eukprot:TRINITY_DN19741_c0_g1_i1.p2 TRINITY_DN19741_c0_g1~~TRINITY_DN19741_c0_g1_i1.p2  ORF type:complete len:161 (+),score=26.85 TRINITY_DN19741_c0_g1_i1:32-514(+)
MQSQTTWRMRPAASALSEVLAAVDISKMADDAAPPQTIPMRAKGMAFPIQSLSVGEASSMPRENAMLVSSPFVSARLDMLKQCRSGLPKSDSWLHHPRKHRSTTLMRGRMSVQSLALPGQCFCNEGRSLWFTDHTPHEIQDLEVAYHDEPVLSPQNVPRI